jgi:hypothetical protein
LYKLLHSKQLEIMILRGRLFPITLSRFRFEFPSGLAKTNLSTENAQPWKAPFYRKEQAIASAGGRRVRKEPALPFTFSAPMGYNQGNWDFS